MTKADIIQVVHDKLGYSKKDSAKIVESVFDVMKETLSRGEDLKISGFGNLVVKEKKARKGRNPQTGEAIEISKRRVLTFKSSQVLRRAMNSE
jgi:integration host factor subunit alpha